MSYSLFCDFYVDKEPKLTIQFDELKNLNTRRYSAALICKEINTDIQAPSGISSYQWFDMNSFVNTRDELQKEYEKAFTKKVELEINRKSVPFIYQLEEYKLNIEDEIENCKETMEDCLYGISSCDKMIGIISLLEDKSYAKSYEEFDFGFNSHSVKVMVYAI